MIVKATILLIACLSLPVQAADAPDAPMVTEASTVATATTTVTAPSATTKTNQGFSPLPSAEKGRVLISGVRIPKTEPAVSAFYIFGMLSTPKTDVPFNVHIYDVTNTPILVGDISGSQHGGITPSMSQNASGWIELDLPIGKHTLTITTDGFTRGTSLHTDFIEVMVEAQQVKHVSISQYGFMRFTYLGEILLEQKHYDFCTSLPTVDYAKSSDIRTAAYKKRTEAIQAYMVSNAISAKATDFADYCQVLTEQQPIHKASEAEIKAFEADKVTPMNIKTSHYKNWQAQTEKPLRYDLMHEYEAPKKVKSGLAYEQ